MTPEDQARYEFLIKALEPFIDPETRDIESARFFAAQLELAALIKKKQRSENGGVVPQLIVRATGVVSPPSED